MLDRLRLALAFGRAAGRWTVRRAARPLLRAANRSQAGLPDRLLIAPQDIRTADPTVAAEIGAGSFSFGGQTINLRGRAFPDPGEASPAWHRHYAGFGWLRHLRAAEEPSVRASAEIAVATFIASDRHPASRVAAEPAVAARRLLSWLSQSPLILATADRAFYLTFLRSLHALQVQVRTALGAGLPGSDRLLAAIALTAYELCVEGRGASRRRGSAALAAAIAEQVLPDGGHISRNPQATIDLLLDLLPLRQAYAARAVPAPPQVLNAIDRMMPTLRLFRLGDGTLARFNGMGATAPERVATILAYDDLRATPIENARYAGYQRLEQAGTVLVVDAGRPPPPAFSRQAHAGCLAFEFSAGRLGLVINCGAANTDRASLRDAARSTPAHSTLSVDDMSSCRFAGADGLQRRLAGVLLSGPQLVTVERRHDEHGATLALSHDGYRRSFGLVHQRTLTLAADGSLAGRDALVARGATAKTDRPYCLRFHLDPAVRVRAGDPATALLHLEDGSAWSFTADRPVNIEPSVLFASSGGSRPTLQLVVRARTLEQAEIAWRFARLTPALD